MHLEDLTFESHDAPLPAEVEIVDEGLDRHNQQSADFGAVHPFTCLVRSIDGTVIGGALARRWGTCSEIQQLWVDPAHRSHGIGREIVRRIERQAREHGCTLLFLETFSFQAPEFYRRAGYEVACEFQGFPDGVSKFIMRKKLVRVNDR